jgi:hypothetical protein
MQDYYEGNTAFHAKTKESQDISKQSLYLQTQESFYIVTLVKYLFDIVLKELKTRNEDLLQLPTFKDTLIDRRVDIPHWMYYFFFIPFFDGLYVGSEDGVMKQLLCESINDFNTHLKDTGSLIQFKEKKIERSTSKLNQNLLRDYEMISSFLRDISSQELNEMFILLDINPLVFTSSEETTMEFEARKFRRTLYSKILYEVTQNNTVLNPTFLPTLRNRYDARKTTYKENLLTLKEAICNDTQIPSDLHDDSLFSELINNFPDDFDSF